MSHQITTITFLKYATLRNKIWAFRMMGLAHKDIADTNGLRFYRLMGSGKGMGFNPLPDWSVYCLIQVWDNEEAAEAFFQFSSFIKKCEERTEKLWTLYMRNISAVGSWVNQNPFEKGAEMDTLKPIAVITRATIKWNWLLRFWKYVPTSQEGLAGNDGLLFTKGVGEVPIVQMATFSLWKDFDALKRFAYSSRQHQEAIHKTRRNEWYKEELFARFHPYQSISTWDKKNPLDF